MRSPESAPTSDVRDETLSSIISRSSSFDRVQLAWLRKLSGVMIVSRAETPICHFARGYLSLCRLFTAAVWCVPALRVPLVHSLINHFRQKG